MELSFEQLSRLSDPCSVIHFTLPTNCISVYKKLGRVVVLIYANTASDLRQMRKIYGNSLTCYYINSFKNQY